MVIPASRYITSLSSINDAAYLVISHFSSTFRDYLIFTFSSWRMILNLSSVNNITTPCNYNNLYFNKLQSLYFKKNHFLSNKYINFWIYLKFYIGFDCLWLNSVTFLYITSSYLLFIFFIRSCFFTIRYNKFRLLNVLIYYLLITAILYLVVPIVPLNTVIFLISTFLYFKEFWGEFGLYFWMCLNHKWLSH